ncbi:hypothetical protein [Acinetobacter sp. ASP199]|uniref:hypothetical protein n=1 Tax=unclassified Acinetobacter TaxID=196816 RepID=UPI001F61FE26|nr:hypothetical protein [Acinetobacter sp. ASP199]UNT60441.1 hypothetical protein IHE35_06475 [Acinetobacter sp. ASP199]
MDIQNFIEEFKKTYVYDILSQTLSDEQLFEHVVDGDAVLWFKEQTRQMWLMWEKAQAQAVPDMHTPVVLALEDIQSKIAQASFLTMDADNENEVYAVDANELAAYINELIEAQDPAND